MSFACSSEVSLELLLPLEKFFLGALFSNLFKIANKNRFNCACF